MSIFYLLPIPLSLLIESYWLKDYQDGKFWYLSFGFLTFSITWAFLGVLIQMEHSRNLNNELYCHKLFWVINPLFIFIISLVVIFISQLDNDYVDYIFMTISFAGSVTAFVMMLKTKPKKRVRVPDRESIMESISDANTSISYKETPIRIMMDYSLNSAEEIKFKVETESMSRTIKRKFNEFLDIQSYLLEYIQKHLPEKVSEVPTIDKSKFRADGDRTFVVEKRLK